MPSNQQVYGEEVVKVDISNGLWLAGSNMGTAIWGDDSTPNDPGQLLDCQTLSQEGYATALKNMVRNVRHKWIPRQPFRRLVTPTTGQVMEAQANTYNGFQPFVTCDETKMAVGLPAYKINQPEIISLSNRTLYNYQPNPNTGTVGLNSIVYNATAQTYQPRTFTMYKDRMYACNTAGAWYRLTGWGSFNTTPFSFTETLLPGANNTGMTGLTGIFAFKDRLFAYRDNRVFYTDVAAAGGYPETWDQTINFFDIASAGSPAIYNAFVIQNLVYLMTEDGIYSLQVYGTPDLWIVRKLRDDAYINHHYAATSNNGLIYFCNSTGVYAYNGDKIVPVSDPLEAEFDQTQPTGGVLDYGGGNGYSVAAFEKGILLTVQIYRFSVNHWIVTSGRVFYFDGEVWSEFTISTQTSAAGTIIDDIAPVLSITSSVARRRITGAGTAPYSDLGTILNLQYVTIPTLAPAQTVMYYDLSATSYNDDLDSSSFFGGKYMCVIATPWIQTDPIKNQYFKKILFDIYGGNAASNPLYAVGISLDGELYPAENTALVPIQTNTPTVVSDWPPGRSLIAVPGMGMRRAVLYQLVYIPPLTTVTDLIPTFELEQIYVVINTSRIEPTGTSAPIA